MVLQVSPVRRMFDILRKDGCQYVAPDDLKTMMAGILLSHPGLEFLQETPEFQDRYMHLRFGCHHAVAVCCQLHCCHHLPSVSCLLHCCQLSVPVVLSAALRSSFRTTCLVFGTAVIIQYQSSCLLNCCHHTHISPSVCCSAWLTCHCTAVLLVFSDMVCILALTAGQVCRDSHSPHILQAR